jgi:hypothetical protein
MGLALRLVNTSHVVMTNPRGSALGCVGRRRSQSSSLAAIFPQTAPSHRSLTSLRDKPVKIGAKGRVPCPLRRVSLRDSHGQGQRPHEVAR